MPRDDSRDGSRRPLVSKGDVGLALTEPAHAVLVRIMGEDRNARCLERLARLATRLRPQKRQHLNALFHTMIGPRQADVSQPDYATSLISTQLKQRMYLARLAKDKDWRPEITLIGADAVENAHADGKGVVLWMLPQEMTSLLLRLCAQDHDWDLHHMSHWMHGQSVSRLGSAVFNQRDCRIEDQFARRILMTETSTNAALKTAGGVLRGGGCVSFRGIGWAQKPIYFPFFEGHIHLAFGAPVLARRVGATVLTVATRQTGTGFELTFEPLDVDKPRSLVDMGGDFVSRLEEAVLASPNLWPAKSRQWAPGAPPVPFGTRSSV